MPRSSAVGGVSGLAGLDQERSRLVVVLLVPGLQPCGLGGVAGEHVARVAEVDVTDHVRARPHVVRDMNVGDELFLCRVARVVDVAERVALARLVLLGSVAEDELGLFAVRVVEEEGDSRLFEHAAHEVVVGLFVLDLVLELRILARVDPPLDGDVPLRQHLADDRRDGDVLVNPVVDPLREQPEPGHDDEVVRRAPLVGDLGPRQLHVADDTAPEPHAAEGVGVGRVDAERGGLADQRVERQARIRRSRPDRDREERGEAFVDGEPPHREGRLAGRKGQFESRHDGRFLSSDFPRRAGAGRRIRGDSLEKAAAYVAHAGLAAGPVGRAYRTSAVPSPSRRKDSALPKNSCACRGVHEGMKVVSVRGS